MGNDGHTGVFTTYTGVQPQPCTMIGTRVFLFFLSTTPYEAKTLCIAYAST